jgi:uncharacterized protein YpmS
VELSDEESTLLTKLLELAAEDEVGFWQAAQIASRETSTAFDSTRRVLTQLVSRHWIEVYRYDQAGHRVLVSDGHVALEASAFDGPAPMSGIWDLR